MRGSKHHPDQLRRRRCGGFTLTETLIASTILAASVSALVVPFSLAASQQRTNAAAVTASVLAEQMIERLVAMSYSQALAMDGTSESDNRITDSTGQPFNDESLQGFTRTVAVDEVAIALPGQEVEEAAVFGRLVVTVTHPDAPDVALTRLVAGD